MTPARALPWVPILLAPLWIVAVGSGMAALIEFANAPGNPGAPPPTWPRDTRLVRSPGRPALVLFAHPRCPCTRASLEELARIVAHLRDRVAVHVLLMQPAGAAADWSATDLAATAAGIPGVEVVVDRDGEEARRFHAETSGHTLLYDARGRLLFSGGITGARGHAGDNRGQSAIVALVEQRASPGATSFVFGCPLHDRSPTAEEVLTP